MATSAVEVDAAPSVVDDTTPSVDIDAIPIDSLPRTFNEDTSQTVHILDPILNKLTTTDYISIFFLLIDVKLEKRDFLSLIKKDIEYFRNRFLNIYFEFLFKDALLIEIFGTMQRYDLLKSLGTCRHIFEKDKDTFTQLRSQWKFLYAVCEQLTDSEVEYLKEKLFPGDININVYYAEELICQAFLDGKLEEMNWKSKLVDIFKSSHPECSRFITSYKGSNLSYYPLRRPTKEAYCGIAVIMNHVTFDGNFPERPESISDANALKKLWESFGFKTVIHTDFTAREVIEVFENLSREDHSKYDAFVACYLSHGDTGSVFTKDCKCIKLTDLTDLIANYCGTLVGKPKLFFVQACQGPQIQTGVGGRIIPPTSQPIQLPTNLPIQHLTLNTPVPLSRHTRNVARGSDVLLFNSSIEGFASFRDGNGSWFIGALVSNMEKCDAEDLTMANVLLKVKEEVTMKEGAIQNTNITKCKQTPVVNNTLRHELKLKKVL